MHLLLRDLIKDNPLVKESKKIEKKSNEEEDEEEKKAQHPAEFEPMTSRVCSAGVFSTAVLKPCQFCVKCI